MKELADVPDKIEKVLGQMGRVKEIAGFMADTRAVLSLGRHVGYPVAMEGRSGLAGLAYIHAEGFRGGRAQARAHRAHRARAAGVRHGAIVDERVHGLHGKAGPNIQRSVPAVPAPRHRGG